MFRADWLEEAVWEECRQFILNPGDALEETQRSYGSVMNEATSTTSDVTHYLLTWLRKRRSVNEC
jgi:hypothetical protein